MLGELSLLDGVQRQPVFFLFFFFLSSSLLFGERHWRDCSSRMQPCLELPGCQ